MTIGEIMSDITEKILKRYRSKRVVRWKEIADFLQDQVKATTAVQWLLKSGKAISIKKGLYYLKRPNEWLQDELEINPLLIAGHIHPEGVIGYHAALKCYGVAYSESNVFQIALPKSIKRAWKTFSYQNASYEFYRANLNFGVASSVVEDVRVQHFSRERILLEGLMYPDRFLGMDEFLKSIESFPWINPEHLFDMVKHYPIKTISMRLGWLLEKYKQQWHVTESYLRQLENNRTESRILLVKNKPRGNYLVKRWSLMVPKTLGI
jgi:predicted transcriptional regulator of viral defense system